MNKLFFKALTLSLGGLIVGGTYFTFSNKNETFVDTEIKHASFVSQTDTVKKTNQSKQKYVDFTEAASLVTPAVVHIIVTASVDARTDPFDQMFEDFFGHGQSRRSPQKRKGSGSGVIISKDGYIVTNNHVIDFSEEIEVILNDKRSFKASVVGADPNTDLALIKINAKDLPFVPYGNSDDIKIGEWVLAVGNPFNLTSTVTAGIVSAKARNIGILGNPNDPSSRPIEAFIQTDAAINPGNSGGALVNTSGQLIGINAAIASQTGSYSGYGFAIPSNLTKKVIEDLLKYGKVQRGFLGIQYRENNAELAAEKGLETTKGVYIEEVTQDGAADLAGIRKGDLAIKVNNHEINTGSDLQEQIGMLRPGDKINIVILRGDTEKNVVVTLKNSENKENLVAAPSSEVFDALGAKFVALSDKDKKKLKISSGMQITSLKSDSYLAMHSIEKGFIVTKVNNKPVNSEDDIKYALNQGKTGMVAVEGIYPNDPYSKYMFSFSINK